MPTKVFKGNMWKVMDITDKDSSLPVVISSNMVETENRDEALNIILLGMEKKKCPECGGRTCLHPRSILITPFKEENIDYVSCFCLKKRREFIIQRKVIKSDNIKNCHFCDSDFIYVNKAASSEEYIDITCRQCGQNYVLCKK